MVTGLLRVKEQRQGTVCVCTTSTAVKGADYPSNVINGSLCNSMGTGKEGKQQPQQPEPAKEICKESEVLLKVNFTTNGQDFNEVPGEGVLGIITTVINENKSD